MTGQQIKELLEENQRLLKEVGMLRGVEDNILAGAELQYSIHLAQSKFIRNHSAIDIFDDLLKYLLGLTKSEYGFIGEVLYEASTPYLQTYAITDISWSTDTRQFYSDNTPAGLVFSNLKSLFGQVMTTGKVVIANQPSTDIRSGGLPEGHPSLDHFLGLPIYSGARLCGMVGIANRPNGYDTKIVEYLQPFLSTCANIIDAVQTEKDRERIQRDLTLSNEEKEKRAAELGIANKELAFQNQEKEKRAAELGIANKELAFQNQEKEKRAAELGIANSKIAGHAERLSAVIDNIMNGVITISERGTIETFNPAAMSIFGYKEEEVVGQNVNMLMPEPYYNEHDGYLKHRLETGEKRVIGTVREFTGLRKDGTVFPMELAVNPILVNSVTHFVGIVRDISERKDAEEARIGFERQILHAQKLESLGVLAGGIAHDFNNLLTSIQGNTELALQSLPPHSPTRDSLQAVELASRRAADLTNQMLAYSGKGKFVIEPIELHEFIDEMADLLNVSISKMAVLSYDFADNLPAFDGDATQIRQIIMNLIINASDAIGDRSGVIALSTGIQYCDPDYIDSVDQNMVGSEHKPVAERMYVYIEVTDTGTGMMVEDITKIFDPFFTTKFTGRGLGLSATLGIVRGHKGAIKVHSEVGKGTTFKVLFPANEAPKIIQAATERKRVVSAWRGKGTILIVDDDESICAMASSMVEKMGFDALTAADGRQGVEMYRQHRIEIVCVLLDLTMPQMDGEEAFRALRLIQPDVNVILCSGYNEEEATQRFANKGLADFIQKPYRMETLKEALAALPPSDGERHAAPQSKFGTEAD
jgi:PAS domain S-box-containing protein